MGAASRHQGPHAPPSSQADTPQSIAHKAPPQPQPPARPTRHPSWSGGGGGLVGMVAAAAQGRRAAHPPSLRRAALHISALRGLGVPTGNVETKERGVAVANPLESLTSPTDPAKRTHQSLHLSFLTTVHAARTTWTTPVLNTQPLPGLHDSFQGCMIMQP